jgi:hypothetical protein
MRPFSSKKKQSPLLDAFLFKSLDFLSFIGRLAFEKCQKAKGFLQILATNFPWLLAPASSGHGQSEPFSPNYRALVLMLKKITASKNRAYFLWLFFMAAFLGILFYRL